jgi:parvulin-like peptidyl-prolyl isomerase
VPHELRRLLSIGVLLVFLGAGRPSLAQQDWTGAGQGYTPMPPTGTSYQSSNLNRQVVPGPPSQPTAASRPQSWPTGGPEGSPWVPPDQQSAPPQAPANGAAPANDMVLCPGMRKLAQVGTEGIFESDVIGAVNEVIEKNKERIPPDQLEAQREILIRQRLSGLIETKLIFLDAKRTIPSEGWSHVESQLTKHFEDVELDKMMKKSGANTRQEFDQKLRTLGTSLEREKRAFIERSLAQEWIQQKVKRSESVNYDQDIVAYYHQHISEFTTPTRVQWEELKVRYAKYPNRAAAYEAIARMGNQVATGAPFSQVAQAGSDGLTAPKGGVWPWTCKGSLTCQELDQTLFNLPVGQLSPIIAGDNGLHIIRVTAREEQKITPFVQAQVDIKKKIADQRSQRQYREYMDSLRTKTPVWHFLNDKNGVQLQATPGQPLLR